MGLPYRVLAPEGGGFDLSTDAENALAEAVQASGCNAQSNINNALMIYAKLLQKAKAGSQFLERNNGSMQPLYLWETPAHKLQQK